VIIPRIDAHEPLGLEIADFARSIRTGAAPRSNAKLGLEIVSVIEAAQASMRRNGAPISLAPASDRIAA
jgi:predicted dehydrogenase